MTIRDTYFADVSTIKQWDFGTVSTMSCFLFFNFYYILREYGNLLLHSVYNNLIASVLLTLFFTLSRTVNAFVYHSLKMLCLQHEDQVPVIILYIIVSNCSGIKMYCLISYDIANKRL